MFKLNRAVHTALALLLSLFLLAACGGDADEPEETEASPTTGEAGAFEITGTVKEVEIDDGEASPEATGSPTASPTGSPTATASPTGSPTGPVARLLVEIESINSETSELCDVDEGDEVTLVVSKDTTIDPEQELEALDELVDRTVTAEGNAEEITEEDEESPGAGEESPSPTGTAGATATGTTAGGASPTGTDGEDPGAGCNFEVDTMTVEEEEGTGSPATGGGSPRTGGGSPTPAPAGGGDATGGTSSPTPTSSPTGGQTPGGASPTSGGMGS